MLIKLICGVISMKSFENKDPFSFSDNLLHKINKNWFLITAGNLNKYNMMTASWGTFGILWNKPVAQIFVRPSRYTHQFIQNTDIFSISFFNSSYKEILSLLGSKSGRNLDKMNISGLTVIKYDNDAVYFDESDEVLVCKKIYETKLDYQKIPEDSLNDFYPENDYHSVFIGQIIRYLKKI